MLPRQRAQPRDPGRDVSVHLEHTRPYNIHACWARRIKLRFSKRTMKTQKRPPGRPKKKEGTRECWRFFRDGMAMSAYDEARESGQKHSAAITQSVDHVRKRCPKMPMSETGVRRALATYRPRGSQTILQFKRVTLNNEQLTRRRWITEQLASVEGRKGLRVPLPSIDDLPKRPTVYMFGYAERPVYPRHNRQIPKA
jgi:hypothetical protein